MAMAPADVHSSPSRLLLTILLLLPSLLLLLLLPTSAAASRPLIIGAIDTIASSTSTSPDRLYRRLEYELLVQSRPYWRGGNVITYAFDFTPSSNVQLDAPASTYIAPSPSSSSPSSSSSSSSDSPPAELPPSPLAGVSIPQIMDAVHNAFAVWSRVIPLTFQYVDPTASEIRDIVFRFGPLGNLGSSVMGSTRQVEPLDMVEMRRPDEAEIWFATEFKWSTYEDHHRHRHHFFFIPLPHLHHHDNPPDVESVAIHEIGHALGLNHSTVANAIMFPSMNTRKTAIYRTLDPDDIAAAQFLYGVAEAAAFPSGPSSSAAATLITSRTSSAYAWFLIRMAFLILAVLTITLSSSSSSHID